MRQFAAGGLADAGGPTRAEHALRAAVAVASSDEIGVKDLKLAELDRPSADARR